ncbi:CLUMA_CG020540, isoform A [Clunio marinus]|uniref:CLUMA_CG020540, isoform A n=1 Tax=Clunio marinus TaxID=568069 RepID=A0A1J1J5B0_9DIPT|nr:CLUMA_CG020540, isoform A [Clunio marinus]
MNQLAVAPAAAALTLSTIPTMKNYENQNEEVNHNLILKPHKHLNVTSLGNEFHIHSLLSQCSFYRRRLQTHFKAVLCLLIVLFLIADFCSVLHVPRIEKFYLHALFAVFTAMIFIQAAQKKQKEYFAHYRVLYMRHDMISRKSTETKPERIKRNETHFSATLTSRRKPHVVVMLFLFEIRKAQGEIKVKKA